MKYWKFLSHCLFSWCRKAAESCSECRGLQCWRPQCPTVSYTSRNPRWEVWPGLWPWGSRRQLAGPGKRGWQQPRERWYLLLTCRQQSPHSMHFYRSSKSRIQDPYSNLSHPRKELMTLNKKTTRHTSCPHIRPYHCLNKGTSTHSNGHKISLFNHSWRSRSCMTFLNYKDATLIKFIKGLPQYAFSSTQIAVSGPDKQPHKNHRKGKQGRP